MIIFENTTTCFFQLNRFKFDYEKWMETEAHIVSCEHTDIFCLISYHWNAGHKTLRHRYHHLQWRNLAVDKTLYNFGISKWAGSAFVLGALQGVDIILQSDESNAVDRKWIRCDRTNQEPYCIILVTCKISWSSPVWFIPRWRKVKTTSLEANRKKVIIEKDLSLQTEPGSEYISFVYINFRRLQNILKTHRTFFSYALTILHM